MAETTAQTIGFFMLDLALLLMSIFALWVSLRLYQLLMAGELGRAWLFIIFGTAMLVFKEILRIGSNLQEVLFAPILDRIIEAAFLIMLCFALWKQWSSFDFLRYRSLKAKRSAFSGIYEKQLQPSNPDEVGTERQ